MGGFDQQSVNENGGVAWAKQVAESMDPGAIDSQIQAYQQAAGSLSTLQTTLQNVKNNLAASWSGDAADQAQQSFQASVNHAQLVQDTINQAVIPPLKSAMAAQQTYISTIHGVPDEQPVPSNSWVDDVEGFFGSQTPAQKVQAHNTAARAQAADAINKLSDGYDSSAGQLSSVYNESPVTPTNNDNPYPIDPAPSHTGDGAASGYSQNVSTGGTTPKAGDSPSPSTGKVGQVSDPHTSLAGAGNPPPSTGDTGPIGGTGPSSIGTGSPQPQPVWLDPVPINTNTESPYNKGGLITDDPEEDSGNNSGSSIGEENLNERGGGSQGGVFDDGVSDGELTGGTGSGVRGGTASGDGSSLVGDGDVAGASSGAGEGETAETGMGGGMGRGMGAGSEDEDLGSSRYSRGRFFDEENDDSSQSPVRSVYEDATDAAGNKVNMMAPGHRGVREDDEEDEREKRPSYLKEDEFWKNAQRIVPPVIQ